jgi:hypothetical protein
MKLRDMFKKTLLTLTVASLTIASSAFAGLNDYIIKQQAYVTFQKADYDELTPLIMQQDLGAIKEMAAQGRLDVINAGTRVHLVHGTIIGPEQVRIVGSTQTVWIDRHELQN